MIFIVFTIYINISIIFLIFLSYSFAIARSGKKSDGIAISEQKKDAAKVETEEKKELSMGKAIFLFLIGLAGLVFGGNWMVDGASGIASLLGVSQSIIALTIVAAGTSFPELITSVVAARKGDTDMAMRFDLTVPLARYVAQHCGELVFPFRRYHIGKVYRGERPQKGRFREFYQCDIDIVGSGSLSLLSEAEIVSVINATFEALNIGEFTIMINNIHDFNNWI